VSDLSEARSGKMMIAFDGRVFEAFGFSGPVRYHVEELELEVKDPDKKGRRDVIIGSRWRGMAQFTVEEADWPSVEPVLQRVQEACASVAPE
jgi:hypothetical protein